jgi:hypothetical protein
MTVAWLLATVMGDNKIDDAKNAGKLLADLITMGMRRCDKKNLTNLQSTLTRL